MRTPKSWIGYAAAIATTAVAALVRAAYDWWFGPEPVYLIPFLVPVAIAGWFSGLRCGLFAVALNAGVAVFFFTQPVYSFGIASPGDAVRVGVFVAVGVGITLLNHQLHLYWRQAEDHTRESLVRQAALEQEVAARQEANATLERRVAERTAALQESERRFRAIFHSQFQFVGLMSTAGVLLKANRTALAAAGVSEGAVLGRPFWETPWWTHDPAQQDRLREAVRRAAAGQTDRFEASHPRADGTLVWVDFSLTPYRDNGEVVLLIPEGRDVTERKQAAEAVRASEERFREFMAHAPLAAWVTDRDECLRYVSPGFESLLSLSPDRTLGKTSHDLFPPEIAARHMSNNRQVLAAGRVVEEEEAFLYADGSAGVAHVVKFPMRGAAGEPLVGGVALDITTRRRAEAVVQESEERFRAAMGGSLDSVYFLAAERTPTGAIEDFRFTELNQRGCDLLARTREQVLGQRLCEMLPVNRTAGFFDKYVQVVKTGKPLEEEFRVAPSDGLNATWLRHQVIRVGDGVTITTQDITARKQIEAALRLSEERFRRLVEGVTGHAIFMLDPDGHVVSWNTAAVRLKGYTADEIIGRHFSVFYTPEQVAAGHPRHELAVAIAEGRYQEEGQRVRKDGSVFWADVTISTLRDDDGRHVGFVKFTHDITARKQAEKALRAGEERLRMALRGAEAGVWECTLPGWGSYWSPEYRDLYGFTADEDARVEKWRARVHPDDLPRIQANLDALAEPGRDTWQQEFRLVVPGHGVRWILDFVRVIRSPDGTPIGVGGVNIDITARKLAEGVVAASLKEKEVLLKEIHHRVKNNLQIVSALLELQAGHADDPAVVEMFSESQGRVLSMAMIHERLYKSADLARVDFTEYVTQLAADLYRAYKVSDDDIRLDLDIAIPPLPIDIAIPCGLLLNELISNCLKHAFKDADRGCLRVEFRREDDGSNVLAVADDGPGLPDGFDLHNTL